MTDAQRLAARALVVAYVRDEHERRGMSYERIARGGADTGDYPVNRLCHYGTWFHVTHVGGERLDPPLRMTLSEAWAELTSGLTQPGLF